MQTTDSRFAATIATLIAILCLVVGYVAAILTSPKIVECQTKDAFGHIHVMRCEIK